MVEEREESEEEGDITDGGICFEGGNDSNLDPHHQVHVIANHSW